MQYGRQGVGSDDGGGRPLEQPTVRRTQLTVDRFLWTQNVRALGDRQIRSRFDAERSGS